MSPRALAARAWVWVRSFLGDEMADQARAPQGPARG